MPNAQVASFRGGLLRLLMVGAVLYLLHPSLIWLHIAVAAFIDLIFRRKEGWTTKKARRPVSLLGIAC